MRDLEARVKQLSVEVENGNLLRQKVTQEKAELEIHIAGISAELQEANCRYCTNSHTSSMCVPNYPCHLNLHVDQPYIKTTDR